LPNNIKGIVFDIDSTLYTNEEYTEHQHKTQINRLAQELNQQAETVEERIRAFRESYKASNNGKSISLGNVFIHFGVPITKSVKWRKQYVEPERFLSRDGKLVETIKQLYNNFSLICVTNNPTDIGRRTLDCLGISEFFPHVVGLDILYLSKPDVRIWTHAAELLRLQYHRIVSIGDRYAVDVEYPLKMGMGGVVVDSVKDVYRLPEVLPGLR